MALKASSVWRTSLGPRTITSSGAEGAAPTLAAACLRSLSGRDSRLATHSVAASTKANSTKVETARRSTSPCGGSGAKNSPDTQRLSGSCTDNISVRLGMGPLKPPGPPGPPCPIFCARWRWARACGADASPGLACVEGDPDALGSEGWPLGWLRKPGGGPNCPLSGGGPPPNWPPLNCPGWPGSPPGGGPNPPNPPGPPGPPGPPRPRITCSPGRRRRPCAEGPSAARTPI